MPSLKAEIVMAPPSSHCRRAAPKAVASSQRTRVNGMPWMSPVNGLKVWPVSRAPKKSVYFTAVK